VTALENRRFAALSGGQRRALLRRLVELDRVEKVPSAVPPRDPADPLRLGPAQRDLWVFETLYPHDAALNLCCAYHFDAPVSPADLETTLTILSERHDALRTRISGTAEDLRVAYPRDEPFRLELQDLRTDGASLDEVLRAYSRRPFDLDGGRLIRGCLVRVDDTRSALVLALHHIITDWWSFDILHAQFAEVYRSVREGLPQQPRRSEIQYADFAAWQNDLESTGVLDARLDFWRGYLDRPPQPLSVGPVEARDGAAAGLDRVAFDLDPALARRLRDFAREHGTTVYGLAMTAFGVLAHRLSGQDDLLLGTPVSNRSAKGLHRMIGYVMNLVPVRWTFGPEDTFHSLLRRFAADFPRILAHGDVPLGRIVQMVGPERLPHRSPLFQWIFMHLGMQQGSEALQQVTRTSRVHTGGEHDVVGVLHDTAQGLSGGLEFRAALYPAALVRRWVDAYILLLDGLTAEPDRPVRTIAVVPEAERRRMHAARGDPEHRPYPETMADFVARHAADTPQAPALESGETRLDYRRLHEQAGRLARWLLRHGAGPDAPVVTAMGRSAGSAIAALAAQRAGAAFVPVDPELPAERFLDLVADAAPAVLVTDSAHAKALPRHQVPQLVFDIDDIEDAEPEADGPEPPEHVADPREAAYVTFTSGSTGRPKGVVVTHTGIAAMAESIGRGLALSAHDRMLQIASPSFDMSVGEYCSAFRAGATLVIPQPGPLAGPRLEAVLAELRITATFIPPALLAGVAPERCPDLAAVCASGDACPAELVRIWSGAGRRFVNHYGPTEDTVGPTITGPLTDGRAAPPIGRAIPGARLYVLDDALQTVPVGTPGELYLSGLGLARGYLGRPGPTSERFVADPYAAEPGARMYRTGDLVRRREDGQLDYLGRTDRQLKLHGLRIEPGEVEAALSAHESVAEAAVALRENAGGSKQLVAYLVAREAASFDPRAVLAHAATSLPRSMVPSTAVEVERLPLTPRGKLDHRALAGPVDEKPPSDPVSDAARTPREQVLCRLFAEVLGLPQVGRDVNFFDAGGHSLLALRLLHAIEAESGQRLSLAAVLDAPTPAELASRLESPDDDLGLTPLLVLRGGGERTPLFCIHPGSGTAFGYAALLPHLEPERPLYGVQSPTLTQETPAPEDMELLAELYIGQIRAVQPEGPYLLAGWSFGGLLAYEMAARLRRAGQEVGLLALIDAMPVDPAAEPVDAERIEFETLRLLAALARTIPEDAPRDRPTVLNALHESGWCRGWSDDRLGRLFELCAGLLRLCVGYRPPEYDGTVHFLSASADPEGESTAAKAGFWQRTAAHVVAYEIDCLHAEAMQPGPAREIAAILDPILKEH